MLISLNRKKEQFILFYYSFLVSWHRLIRLCYVFKVWLSYGSTILAKVVASLNIRLNAKSTYRINLFRDRLNCGFKYSTEIHLERASTFTIKFQSSKLCVWNRNRRKLSSNLTYPIAKENMYYLFIVTIRFSFYSY